MLGDTKRFSYQRTFHMDQDRRIVTNLNPGVAWETRIEAARPEPRPLTQAGASGWPRSESASQRGDNVGSSLRTLGI